MMKEGNLKAIVPILDGRLRKGDSGIILVVGGSLEYTGAPYFAAMAALKTGADLAHIICHENAGTAIKSYSPDIIVHPLIGGSVSLEDFERRTRSLSERIDAVVIGPGLGRDQLMNEAAQFICQLTMEKQIPLLLDGDGIGLLIEYDEKYWRGVGRKGTLIVTPNHREMERLCEHYHVQVGPRDASKNLSLALGNAVIVQKGADDLVSNGIRLINATQGLPGCPRRVGGQGDILSGCIAAMLGWNAQAVAPVELIECVVAGTRRVRKAAAECFEVHGRGMLASELLHFVPEKVEDLKRSMTGSA